MSSEVKLPALQIMKAAPQHADLLGSSGLAMLMAICGQWDNLGCARAVCWSNSRLAERSGLSRNSVAKVRAKLIDLGWLCYLPDGRQAGHYTPKLPEYHAQSSAVECASGAQLTVHTVCKWCAVRCAYTVHLRATYIPSPNPTPEPVPRTSADPNASGCTDVDRTDEADGPPVTIGTQGQEETTVSPVPPQDGEDLFADRGICDRQTEPDPAVNVVDLLFRFGPLIKGPDRKPSLEIAARQYDPGWLVDELSAIKTPMWPDALLEHLAQRHQDQLAIIELESGWE